MGMGKTEVTGRTPASITHNYGQGRGKGRENRNFDGEHRNWGIHTGDVQLQNMKTELTLLRTHGGRSCSNVCMHSLSRQLHPGGVSTRA